MKNLKELLDSQENEETPEGFCPNCWGRQEYSGKFYEAVRNRNIDESNFEQNKGWIMNYVEKNLNHIRIKSDKDNVCQFCKVKYEESK